MNKQIGVGNIEITRHEKKYIKRILKTSRLSYGPISKEFEQRFADIHGSKFAIVCSSGTDALRIGLGAMKELYGWQDGDEVIVPSSTFVATVNIILQNNMVPVFVDIDAKTYNIDVSKIKEVITDKTRCIIPVNLFGQPADLEKIKQLVGYYKEFHNRHIAVMQDSCECMFATHYGKKLGEYGEIQAYSGYVAHLVVMGVGGIITTNNKDLAYICRSLANHGRNGIYYSIDDDKDKDGDELKEVISKRFEFERVGYSSRVTEFECAMGLGQLGVYERSLERRVKIAEVLINSLSQFEDLILPYTPDYNTNSHMMFPVVLKEGSKIKREDLTYFLEKNGIETRPLCGLVSQPIYKKMWGEDWGDKFPNSKYIDGAGFYIGCNPYMTPDDVKHIIYTFSKFFGHA